MKINAGRYALEIRELSWWEKEEVKAEITSATKLKDKDISGFDGAAMLKVRMKTIEKSIVSIKEGENDVTFSEAWLRGLTNEEGEALSAAIDEMDKKK